MPLAPGSTIGRYRIESRIGSGAMGVVYLALDERLERRVALKLIEPSLAAAPDFRSRFEREARAAAGLDHPHVLPVYEAGEDGDQLYLAMRYVPGVDLATQLARHGPLDLAATLRLVTQLAAALDAAHASGLIHRDVKPANVLLAPDQHAYLADFGLARSAGPGITRPGQLVGTADYTAPELLRGEPASPASDTYALACLAVECLTGRPPFSRDGELATLYAHANDPVPALTDQRPELPVGLQLVVERGLAKDPGQRYPSAGELAARLAGAFDGGPDSPRSRLTRGWSMPVAAGAGAIALGALVLAVVWSGGLSPPSGGESPSPSSGGESPSPSSAGAVTTIVVPSADPEAGIRPVQLGPGTYRFDKLSPVATFDVPEGNWWAYRDYIDAAGLYLLEPGVQDLPARPEQYAGWLDLGRVQVVFDGACLDSDTILLESSPNALVDWLQNHELLDASTAQPVNLAGYSGLVLDVAVAPVESDPCETDGPAPRTMLFPVGEDLFSLFPDERLRVITLDVSGRPLSILVTSPADRFDAFAESARPILESLDLTP